MIALYIILAVILLLFLATLIPIYVTVKYDDGLRVYAKYMFFKHEFDSDLKEDNKKIEKTKKNNNKSNFSPGNLIKKRGITGLLELIKKLTQFTLNIGKEIVSNIAFDYINIDLLIGGQDAKDTAIKYGYVCSGVYPFVSLLSTVSKLKKKDIKINADFQSDKDIIKFCSKFHIKPLKLLFFIPKALFKLSKIVKA